MAAHDFISSSSTSRGWGGNVILFIPVRVCVCPLSWTPAYFDVTQNIIMLNYIRRFNCCIAMLIVTPLNSTQKLSIRLVADGTDHAPGFLEIGPHGIVRLRLVMVDRFWTAVELVEKEFVFLGLIAKDVWTHAHAWQLVCA